ncbi:alkaline phosphatase D family protein, partial [PVC group bacterium]|nr:alkaline phosphatase D family protein [PVC group bacterium]
LAVFLGGHALAASQDGLVGHWTFNGAAKAKASDTSGKGLRGRIQGASRVGDGKEKALRLDGNDSVDFGSPPDGRLNFGRDRDLSMALWINVSSPPQDQYGIVGKGDRGPNPKVLLKVMRTKRLLFRIAAKTVVDANGKKDVVDGKWHHVAAVADRDAHTRIYVDGALDAEAGPTNQIVFDNDSSLYLGKSHQKGTSARRHLIGYVNDFRLYDRALTEAEIVELARDRTKCVSVPPLIVPKPPERHFAQPHLTASEDDRRRMLSHGQGEMTGEVTETSAILQSRLTWGDKLIGGDLPGCPGAACFELGTDRAHQGAIRTEWLPALPEHDFIVKARVAGLKPATRYYYRLLYGVSKNDVKKGRTCTFKTLPGAAGEQHASFVVVTGMNYSEFHFGARAYKGEDKHLGYPALASILKLKPDFFVGTGDNVYYDQPSRGAAKTQAEIRAKWHEQFIQPRYVELFAHVPTYWEKDDHDHRYNDCDTTGSREPSNELGIATFREQVPVVDPRDKDAVTYRTFRISKHLQIWLVEGRDFRSPNRMPDGPEKTLWGKEQIAWLKRTLLASDATFKILISPTPMIGPDRSSKRDNHANPQGFMHEGRQFFKWLSDNGFLDKHLYFACGDRHWQYHSIDPSGFEEFSSGALVDANAIVGTFPGNPKSNDPEGKIKQPFHPKRASAGFLLVTVSPTSGDGGPTARFAFYDEQGTLLYEAEKRAP